MLNENHPLVQRFREEQRINVAAFALGSALTLIGAGLKFGFGGAILAAGVIVLVVWNRPG